MKILPLTIFACTLFFSTAAQTTVPKYPQVAHANLIKLTPEHIQQFIDTHNKYRTEVGLPPLTWNDNLANFAGEWAVHQGEKGCKMKHRPDNEYGENIYWSSGRDFDPIYTVDQWGGEKLQYHDEVVGEEKAMVGHYTQMVWRTTTEVGCAAFNCGSSLIVICNYNPPGNWIGQHPYKR